MTDDTLIVLLGGAEIGEVSRGVNDRRMFRYRDEWRRAKGATALSVSMPLAVAEHDHEAISAFVWGLLPDNEQVLQRWAQRFQVSPRNPFGLIAEIGEDCPGAVQFVRPERCAQLLMKNFVQPINWLDEGELADRIRALKLDPSQARRADDAGQFSLAGAQPKTALLYQNGRWGVPAGRTPTTHILKPATAEFDGHAENEHFCLKLARAVGLPTAGSFVRRFGDDTVFIVERYDRLFTAKMAEAAATEAAAKAGGAALAKDMTAASDELIRVAELARRAQELGELAKKQPILRLHQEDVCQALGMPPTKKYQNEGGPSPADIVALLRAHSSRPAEDEGLFINALIFNWLIAGTDAHAKNYSLLHGGRGRVRLAPLYDVASILPYDRMNQQRIKMAMKIGGEYRLRDVGSRQWRKLAAELKIPETPILERVAALAEAVITETPLVQKGLSTEGLDHPIIDKLADCLTVRAAACLEELRRFV
jgi:serine/threonine-protein kinase HipA